MYLCMYVYTPNAKTLWYLVRDFVCYMHVHTCMFMYVYVCMYVCMYLCMYT